MTEDMSKGLEAQTLGYRDILGGMFRPELVEECVRKSYKEGAADAAIEDILVAIEHEGNSDFKGISAAYFHGQAYRENPQLFVPVDQVFDQSGRAEYKAGFLAGYNGLEKPAEGLAARGYLDGIQLNILEYRLERWLGQRAENPVEFLAKENNWHRFLEGIRHGRQSFDQDISYQKEELKAYEIGKELGTFYRTHNNQKTN